MKVKKITKLKNLTEQEVNRLSDAYIKEKYITEIIPTYIDKRGLTFEKNSNRYELHVYELIKRSKRWYTTIDKLL